MLGPRAGHIVFPPPRSNLALPLPEGLETVADDGTVAGLTTRYR